MSRSGFLKVEESFDLSILTGSNITFVNPFSWLELTRKLCEEDLRKFKIFADGIGIVHFYNTFLRTKLKRYSFDFTSVAFDVFHFGENNHLTFFFVGGNPGVADEAVRHFLKDFPKLIIAGIESGFFTDLEHRTNVLHKATVADFVIVGMGVPHQEQFLLDMRKKGWTGTGFTCGGFFDQTAKSGRDYYPKLINDLNIRWLFRLFDDPKRLSYRYFIIYPKFIAIFLTRFLFK